jgi:DNA-binding CsgD family transcriptional regulator
MKKQLLWLLCFCLLKTKAQNTIALPEIINYAKQAYHAGMQNWKICQDAQGILYFANNEGLLSFDGSFWKKYVTPSKKGLRSVAIAPDGRLYAGAEGEIGYFEPDANGLLQYHSLNDRIPEKERDFTDIWEVIPVGKEVFFRSFKRIFQLSNDSIKAYSDISWSFMGLYRGQLVAHAYNRGLLLFRQGQWVPLLQKNIIPEKAQVCAILPIGNDSSLVVTKKAGFYLIHQQQLTPYTNASLPYIADKNPYAAVQVAPGQIAIATSLEGCFIVRTDGSLVQRLSKQDGLQNNNILSVFTDQKQNLWLGLDNGIAFAAYNNAIKHLYADYQEHSGGKSALVHNNRLYIGTSNGLYTAPIVPQQDLALVKSNFEMVPGTKGQVWNLSEVNGRLLMGHNDGFFEVQEATAKLIDGATGFWTFVPLTGSRPTTKLLAGTYNGVNFYDFQNQHFTNPTVHSHFESARYVAISGGTAWALHPYKGLYKVTLNGGESPTYTVYNDRKHLLSANSNHLFKVRNRIVITNDNGIFEYNPHTDDFEPSAFFARFFPEKGVQYLKEDAGGNIWFVHNKQLGVVDFSGKAPQTVNFPELNDKVMSSEFEFVYPYDRNNVFVAGEEGFFHINYEAYRRQQAATPILISTVKIIGEKDSTLFGGYGQTGEARRGEPQIGYAWNSLHFGFSAAVYGRQGSVEYAYMLQDFDKNWSAWTDKTEKDYTYLPPGRYTFRVKARTGSGSQSVERRYSFTILPPWYRTTWAYLVYMLLFAAGVYGVHRFQVRRFTAQQRRHKEERKRLEYLNKLQAEKHEEEQKQLLYLHQLERERNEKEIMRLQNGKLEAEIQLKNTELASTTLNLIQKGEMLVKVKEEFVRMKRTNEVEKDSDEYKKIIKMLGEDRSKRDWNQFAIHFDKVHSDFLVTLKSQYPHLTPSELKLCAYLRLNLSSKEIAQVMNISIKSVELARYRLRKKLQMQPEENLFNFLLNFHSEGADAGKG